MAVTTQVVPTPSSDRAVRRMSLPVRSTQWTGANTPARLRRTGLVLLVGCLLLALLALIGGTATAGAVDRITGPDAALAREAGAVYLNLANADANATSGFVSAGREPAAVRAAYDRSINDAGLSLGRAAALLPSDDPAAAQVATISGGLPGYAGLIETARTYNRQGLPLGQGYLDLASRQMRDTLLPAAARLRASQTAALNGDLQTAGAVPFAVLLLGAAVLVGGLIVSRREYERTRRVISPGLVTAGGLVALGLLWWIVASVVSGAALHGARESGDAAAALDEARTHVLQARSNESLVLVARSGGFVSDQGFTDQLGALADPLDRAEGVGEQVGPIRSAADTWAAAHRELRRLDDNGSYSDAVASASGTKPGTSGAAFTELDAAISRAADQARTGFDDQAAVASAARIGLAVGPPILFLLAGAAVVVGISRRVEEYR